MEIPVCPQCGRRLGQRVSGFGIICSSAYQGPGELCHDCQVEHCLQTDCLNCTVGVYPGCKHLSLKKYYKEVDSK